MIIALSTYPDKLSADQAAESIIGKELAACVSILRIEQSVYKWKGKIERSPEFLLVIKTTRKAYPLLETHIKGTHPHKVPEIIYLDVSGGQKDYLGWVEASVLPNALRVPLDLTAIRRAADPSKESISARKPRTLSR